MKPFGQKGRNTASSLLAKAALSAGAVYLANKFFATAVRGRPLELQGQVVLITGGSRGLGFALAQELGSHGCRVALCARDSGELQKACKRLADKKIDSTPFTCDIGNESEIVSLVKRVIDTFGRVDILINNAGHIAVGPFDTFNHDDFERAMSLMFWAPLNLTFALLPYMQRQRRGHIVNITSVGGRVSVPHLLPYSCAKFAFVGFSTGLGAELRSQGIHVLTAVPGLMRTGSYLNAEFKGRSKQEYAWFALLGNLPGFSVAAEYAAGCIRRALQKRRHTCTISIPARILIASETMMPETTRGLLQVATQTLLPDSNGQIHGVSGKVLNPAFGKLFQAATLLGKLSARRLNE